MFLLFIFRSVLEGTRKLQMHKPIAGALLERHLCPPRCIFLTQHLDACVQFAIHCFLQATQFLREMVAFPGKNQNKVFYKTIHRQTCPTSQCLHYNTSLDFTGRPWRMSGKSTPIRSDVAQRIPHTLSFFLSFFVSFFLSLCLCRRPDFITQDPRNGPGLEHMGWLRFVGSLKS